MLTLTEGQFGQAVADVFQKMTGARCVPLRDAVPDLIQQLPKDDFVAVAAWRRNDRDLDMVDEASFAARVRWCAVYLSEDRLVCGPLVIPGFGPCFNCFKRRYLCHHPAPEREMCLQRAYDRDRTLGCSGFVAPIAWIAASMLVMAANMRQGESGRLLEVNLFDAGLLDTRVIAVHNCPRCRVRVGLRTGDRFVNQLVPSIKSLLT